MSAAAPIRFKDFQESDLILYVAYFLKGPLTGPTELLPVLAVSPDACATSLDVAAERLESPVQCITEAAQRKRKTCRKPQRPDPPPKQKQSRHRSPHGAASQGERPSSGKWIGLLAVC